MCSAEIRDRPLLVGRCVCRSPLKWKQVETLRPGSPLYRVPARLPTEVDSGDREQKEEEEEEGPQLARAAARVAGTTVPGVA